MKRIEDIEKMDWRSLETAASEEGTEVPVGLEDRIAELLTAKTEAGKKRPAGKTGRKVVWSSLAAAAAIAAAVTLSHRMEAEPKDTFDDPYLAYAEVEKTFELISQKMSDSIGHVREAKSMAEKPVELYKNTLK